MQIQNTTDFSLKYTLESGQSFRWNRIDNAYYGVVEGRILKITQEGTTLCVESSTDEDEIRFVSYLRHYLDIGRDVPKILAEVNNDAYMHRAIEKLWGMRILNQELWETLASFILSQNNNVSRIRGIIRRLSERFGEHLTLAGYVDYSFPSPDALATATNEELLACGTGYRATYLRDTAQAVVSGKLPLTAMKQMPYSEAKQELMRQNGIGEKVADCICLFSLGHLAALPIDVWIKRIFETLYLRRRATHREIREFAHSYFGDSVGYAQQYLFHYVHECSNWADAEHLSLIETRVPIAVGNSKSTTK
ncbi:8-oxoguanine DNA glycosylase [Candidatus Poribacteria bacterium]|nr:MAG: 8-oxoguanine DNA glycosylase [Candidatus Poribacteria bacterium]